MSVCHSLFSAFFIFFSLAAFRNTNLIERFCPSVNLCIEGSSIHIESNFLAIVYRLDSYSLLMVMMNALAGTRGVCLSPTTTIQVQVQVPDSKKLSAQGDVALYYNSLRGLQRPSHRHHAMSSKKQKEDLPPRFSCSIHMSNARIA